MEEKNIELLKEELDTQLDTYGFNDVSKEILAYYKAREPVATCSLDDNFKDILSAKNEWEDCVDSFEHQAIIMLDSNLKVIRVNRTIELWGWADVKKVRGMHILNLITPAIENDESTDWINEWCQLDTQSNVEWISNNYKGGKTYRFSFFPNRNIDSIYHSDDLYAVMIITDLSQQSLLSDKEKQFIKDRESSEAKDENDYLRLSAYRLHQLATKLITTQEEERKRLSSELHDGVGQVLSGLKYQVEFAKTEFNKEEISEGKKSLLDEILKNVTFALRELRRVSTDLSPSVLEDLGLLLSLKWFAHEYNKIYTNLNIELELDVQESDIPDHNKKLVYRIIQESMNNIAKHAHANNIYVKMAKSHAGILLRITDDGKGFDIEEMQSSDSAGLGLRTMRERAEESGGIFGMSSSSLSGTAIQVFWPNNKEDNE